MTPLILVATGCIVLWALWCVFCPCVQDGVVGKLLYFTVAIGGSGVFMSPDPEMAHGSHTLLLTAIAGLCLRNIAVCYLWPHVTRRLREAHRCCQARR